MYVKFTEPKNLIGIAGNTSGNELIASLPITTGQPYTHKAIYQEVVPDVKAGDIIYAHADWECTTPYSYNLMVCTYLSATETSNSLINYTILSAMNGRNIDLNIHHEQVGRVGMMQATRDYSQLYINFMAYTASTAALSSHTLKVEPGCGRLTIYHYR